LTFIIKMPQDMFGFQKKIVDSLLLLFICCLLILVVLIYDVTGGTCI
jgi:hypothetical protein